MSLIDSIRNSTVGKSFWRSLRRVTDRDRASAHWSNFLLHIYPVKMRRERASFRWSWFLGVTSLVLFGSLIASGVYLMFFYVPSPANAYGDILFLQTSVAFGQFIRNIHRWSAHLMVLAVAAHMAKMFYRGAYKTPREFNWVVGVVLLVLTLLLSFTGYLLPWDQLAYWAVTVGTSMADFVPFIGDTVRAMLLGGTEVGAQTLLRFYVLHVAVLPAALIGLLMLHLWRWRKDSMLDFEAEPVEVTMEPAPVPAGDQRILGFVEGSPPVGDRKVPAEEDTVMVWPHVLIRHGVAALTVMVTVLLIALLFNAPLDAMANPTVTPNPEKAPWYFAALQELLFRFHPLIAGVLVPTAIIIGLVALAYVDRNPSIQLKHRKVAVATFTIFMVVWIALTVIGFAFRGPNWSWVWPWQEWYGKL
jgi:quinol-cytochrome oxidoreductase complex cytochrome b subunit